MYRGSDRRRVSHPRLDVPAIETPNKMKEILKKDDGSLVVLEFMAPWNEPSMNMEQAYNEVASSDDFRGRVEFYKVNFDKFQNLGAKLRVEAMPTFLIMKGRTVIGRIVTLQKDELANKIRNVLAEQK